MNNESLLSQRQFLLVLLNIIIFHGLYELIELKNEIKIYSTVNIYKKWFIIGNLLI